MRSYLNIPDCRICKVKVVKDEMAKEIQESQHVFIIRHGERLDNVDYDWVRTAERPYDPPLTEDGVKEASEAGMRFKDKVK